MPRKKSESVQVTIEIDRGTYEQIEQQSANWGETVTDWLMEAVQENFDNKLERKTPELGMIPALALIF